MDPKERAAREFLRHTVATVAYRGRKAIRFKTDITTGKVGADQAPPRVEFD